MIEECSSLFVFVVIVQLRDTSRPATCVLEPSYLAYRRPKMRPRRFKGREDLRSGSPLGRSRPRVLRVFLNIFIDSADFVQDAVRTLSVTHHKGSWDGQDALMSAKIKLFDPQSASPTRQDLPLAASGFAQEGPDIAGDGSPTAPDPQDHRNPPPRPSRLPKFGDFG